MNWHAFRPHAICNDKLSTSSIGLLSATLTLLLLHQAAAESCKLSCELLHICCCCWLGWHEAQQAGLILMQQVEDLLLGVTARACSGSSSSSSSSSNTVALQVERAMPILCKAL
jgi:hypothetical protein